MYFESKMTYERKHNRLSSNDNIIHIENVVEHNTGLLNFDSNIRVSNIVPHFN